MTNFLEHLARENDTMRATKAWIVALGERGLIVRARAIPLLTSAGKGAEILGHIAGPDYVTAEEMLGDMYVAGIPINCETLKKNPYVRANHLDPDKTLAALRTRGIVGSENSFREAIQYVSHLKHYGVNMSPGTWQEILAKEHREVIESPLGEVELCAASGRLLSRCNPGWSDAHPQSPRYRLKGKWNDNPVLGKVIELYSEQGRLHFTDSMCDDCHQYRMKELEELTR